MYLVHYNNLVIGIDFGPKSPAGILEMLTQAIPLIRTKLSRVDGFVEGPSMFIPITDRHGLSKHWATLSILSCLSYRLKVAQVKISFMCT